MSKSKTSLIFHALVLTHHSVTIFHMAKLANNYSSLPNGRARDMLKVGPRFFTTWNMGIQTVYFLIAFLLDLINFVKSTKTISEYKTKLTKFNGYLYNVIMFPATLLVAIGFWGMFSIKRDWVLPQTLEDASPIWLNHAIHTSIIPVLLGELLVHLGDMPRPKFKTAMISLNFYMAIYTFQYMYTYYQLDFWMYGIFCEIDWTLRVVLLISNFLVLVVFLKIGYWIQNYKRNQAKQQKLQKAN